MPGCSIKALLAVPILIVVSMPLRAAATCTVSITGPVFGIYNPLNASPTLANGAVTATCTWISGGATAVTMVSSYSTGNSGAYATRYMLSGTNRLNYNLYFDSTYTSIRGDGTGGSQTGTATLRVSRGQPVETATSVVYGRIPAGQNVNPGSYLDTVLVTVIY